jgi:O-antigen/teichoic acid export membrane protein
MGDDVAALPGGKRIARNTFWNIVGLCAPILVAVFCIPPMIRGLGEDQFGLLSLVWMLVGYFTIFDMGIGRALTRIAAERIGQGREQDLPALFWTSCGIMLILGTVAGLMVAAIAPWLTTSALHIPAAMQADTLRSFQAVAFSLPIVVMTAGMIGMLEARQRFGLINAVRVPVGSFTFIGPLLILPFSKNLFPVVMILLAGRLVEWLIYFLLCLHDVPALRHGFRWEPREIKPLMSTGGWITISTLIMPFMVHIDRFLIGSILTVGAVTYYATASEIVVKLLIFPRAWVSVLFPTFAAHFGQRQGQTSDLFARSLSWLLGILFPVILLVVAFAPEGFQIWLGSDFAVKSTPVMRWLTTGIFLYCLTYIPFSFLQGIGRPNVTALIHLVELPLFAILAVFTIQRLGIVGAAMAWVIRAALELLVMLFCAKRFAPVIGQYAFRWLIVGAAALAMLAGIVLCEPLLWRIFGTLIGLLIWTALVWFFLFQEEDRAELRRLLHSWGPLTRLRGIQRELLVAALIVAVAAIAWRAALFHFGVRNIPAFDDECKIALQAKQIVRGELSLTILASPYIFPLDAYLMAPFIHFLPRNAFGARIMAFGYGVLTVILSLLILRRWGSWKEIWPGILLVLFPSAYLLILQVGCALPGYPTLMLLGALVIWLAQRHAETRHRVWLPALLAGLAGGLAASDTLLSLPMLLMGGAMIVVARSWKTAFVSAPVFSIGALLGFMPHLLATHIHSDAFRSVEQSVSMHTALNKIVDPVLNRTLPAAFGWGPTIFPDSRERIVWPSGFDLYVGSALVVLLAVFTTMSLWDFVRRWRQERWPRMDTSLAFAGVSWMCLALFLFSARSHYHTYRYFIPIVWSFPFLLGYAYRRSCFFCRVLLGGLTAAWAAVNLIASLGVMERWADPGFADHLKSYDMKPVFQYLDQHSIRHCYATYVDAYRITYETDERILCAQPYNERFPGWHVPFKDLVDSTTNVAFVLSDAYRFTPQQFERDLATMQVKYRKETCGHYEVYTDFQSPLPPPGPEIPASSLAILTSHYSEGAPALHDGSYRNRWRSHRNQKQGMWIEIRLPSVKPVSQLQIYYNQYRNDRARGMRLQAFDGQKWISVLERIPRDLIEFEFRNGHPVYGNDVQDIRFPPVTTDRLRLEIVEEEPKRDWTIGEIKVFETK